MCSVLALSLLSHSKELDSIDERAQGRMGIWDGWIGDPIFLAYSIVPVGTYCILEYFTPYSMKSSYSKYRARESGKFYTFW
jgi:hypothetical protein